MHTKGPWTVFVDPPKKGDSPRMCIVVTGAGDGSIAIDATSSGATFVESEANARLIAAAPSMYEALVKLANEAAGFLALSDIERHGHTNSRILRERIEQARAAIAKAVS